MRGRLGDEADDPGGGRGALRRAARPLPRARGAGGGELRQPPRRARGRAQDGGEVDHTYDGLDNVVTRAEEINGKAGESLREHLGDVIRNRRLNALVCDLDLPLVPDRPGDAALGPPGGAHALRRPGVPGAARPALRDARVRGGDRRLRLRPRHDAARGRRGRRLARRATPARGSGSACTSRAPGRAGTGDVLAVAFATERGHRRLRVGGEHHPRGRRRARRRGSATRTSPRCCTTPRARCWRWPPAAGRCAGSSATPRSRPTSPDPTSAPTTSPTSPCATSSASSSRATTDDGQLSLDGLERRHRRRHRDAARQRGARPGGRARRRARRARRHRAARRRRAAADRRARPDGAGRHRRRLRACSPSSRRVRRPGARGRRRGVRSHRQGDQPRLAQAAAGRAVRRARDAEDQAHQDRLHHRRRRAAGALREDRAPVPRAPAAAPRRDPAPADGRGAARRPWRRTAASTPRSTS